MYRTGNRPAVPLTSAVVTGRFRQASPGAAFTVEGADALAGTLTDFDDPTAMWRTVHATFEVEDVISGTEPGPRITGGLALGPEASVSIVETDLIGLGRTVLFLNRSPVFAYAPSVHGTVFDGALIAPVSDTGALSLPALGPGEAARLLQGSASVTVLREKARGPRRTVQLHETGTERLAG